MTFTRIARNILLAGATSMLMATGAFADTVPLKVSDSAPTEVPEKFKNGEARIAVVRQLNVGDVYQAWIAGVEEEAKKLGVKVEIYDADGDNARQALQLQQAVATEPDAILIGWGFGDSLKAGLDAACAAGIPVVTSNASVPVSDCVTNVNQSDKLMMRGIVDKFSADFGGNPEGDVIYVYVAGYLPLDLRNEVWEEFKAANPEINQVAQIGVVNANTAAQTADQAKAALTANPDTIAIIAPYNEFTKGATLAIEELGMLDKVKAYGMDISTADIAVMTAENSPWVATSTTDMQNFGRVSLRVTAGETTDSYEGNDLLIPPLVITQEELREKGVQNVEELADNFPGLATPGLAVAPWMESLQ
ncbi:MAG: substrate-binding domain-containing protein [Pseudomonadota bacterium]